MDEITGAVAAAKQIDLKYRPANIGECSRLNCCHSARFVHFLCE
jgi:hypothetical protein